LRLVEKTLRARSANGLSASQVRNRVVALDHLHQYWLTGNFPVNDRYTYRTPIFIDQYDNFCAVGYLVKATGYEQVSRMIAANSNLAYVRQMSYPELAVWAQEYGFTTDELAWIQPGYPPEAHCGKIGNGVNGVVNKLYVDITNERMYVGGQFTQVDGSIAAANIAYVTEAGGTYTWHSMGSGVNGRVNAIIKHEGRIYVAGSFTEAGGIPADNIAYWDGTGWHAAGCVNGAVKDMCVSGGNLYAVGDFDDCVAMTGGNFAKWNGTTWNAIPGLMGHVNTIQEVAGSLVLGGSFSYGGIPANAILWNESASFQTCANALNNEVMDLEVYSDSVYAVCSRTHATDTNSLFMVLRNGTWHSAFQYATAINDFYKSDGALALNSLCAETGSLNIGGQFLYSPMMGNYGANCFNMGDYGNWMSVDSAVQTMVMFNNKLIAGGKFRNGNSGGWSGSIPVNGIAARITPGTAVPAAPGYGHTLKIYPNPAAEGTTMSVEQHYGATGYEVYHITGRHVATGQFTGSTARIPLKVPAGVYFIAVDGKDGCREVSKIVVE
jgi:hypothetical protein